MRERSSRNKSLISRNKMLKKRIIPCLDVNAGRTVKGVNFINLRDAGDPVELAARYSDEGADELVFLDITATNEKRKTVTELTAKVAKEISIPFAIGGGVSSVVDFHQILLAGADKVAMNSAAVKNPALIAQCADKFGSQAVVVAIDARQVSSSKSPDNSDWEVYINGGRIPTGIDVLSWAKQVEELGAGEILLTSMDRDGTKSGFDIKLLQAVTALISIPVIASGGVGSMEHFAEVFTKTAATGALAASVFHFGEINIGKLKGYLFEQGIPVRFSKAQ